MATAYAVFANGGHRINPWLIARISDQKGKILVESKAPALNEAARAIDARNAFMMSRLLQEVARSALRPRHRPHSNGQTCMARPAPPTTRLTPGSPATNRRWPPWSGWATTRHDRWATGRQVGG
ncbi:penicillin-binding transpeptidase domain-containing protein [Candidatus Skiveiella danica]|uniref:penicillin-binding transpeptidase domain-containing protein n=1 Tax=Candidatus Skiveiella danica TaxID=3386177 RepID=UPI0039B99693